MPASPTSGNCVNLDIRIILNKIMKSQLNTARIKTILSLIARTAIAGTIVGTLVVMPGLAFAIPLIADLIDSLTPSQRYKFKKTFEMMRRERLISVKQLPNGKVAITITRKGNQILLEYNFFELKLKQPTKWDKTWRFVIFDLPKKFDHERELLRSRLKSLGFYLLQRSIWIHPLPCRDEIDFITEYLGISSFVRIAEVKNFDGEKDLKDIFASKIKF